MLRLFVALRLPEDITQRLSTLQGGIPAARWLAARNMHLTLRFIGEVDEGRAEDIDAVLSTISAAPFSLSLSGVDVFAKGSKPHTLWAGVEESQKLIALKTRVDSALIRAGVPPETRKFTPHVTIARFSDRPGKKLSDFISGNNMFYAGPFEVEDFHLYQSHSTKNGPEYEVLRGYPLTLPLRGSLPLSPPGGEGRGEGT